MKINMARAGGAMVVGGVVVAVMMVHPVTLLAKCTCVLVAGLVGAKAIAPLSKDIETVAVDFAAFRARMAQGSAAVG